MRWSRTAATLAVTTAVVSALCAPTALAKTKIRFSEYPRPQEQEMLKVLLPAFQKENPDIEVVYEPVTDPIKMTTQMIAGSAPDVVCWWGEELRDWAERGMLVDLKPVLPKEFSQNDIADFAAGQIKTFTFKGQLYAIPQYLGTVAIYYNKDYFDAAGVAYPDQSHDWNDLVEMARKLTVRKADKVTQWGYYLYMELDRVAYWVRQNGGEMFADGDNSVVTLDKPEAYKAMQFAADMVWKHKVAPSELGNGLRDAFSSGKTAIAEDGSWSLAFMLPQIKFNLGIAHLAKGPVGRSTMANADGYAITKSSKNTEAALRFLQFITGPYANKVRAEFQALQPARRSVAAEWIKRVKSEYPAAKNAEIQAFAEAFNYAEPGPLYSNQAIATRLLEPAFTKIFYQGQSAEQLMKQVVPTVNAQLKTALAKKK